MIIVMKPNAPESAIRSITEVICSKGLQTHLSEGEQVTIIGVVGDKRKLNNQNIEVMPFVDKIVPITESYKLTNKKFHPQPSRIKVGNYEIGPDTLTIMAGPCAVETEEQLMEIARAVKKAGAQFVRGGAYKPRTSPYSFQGLEEEGLRYMEEAKKETGLATICEVISEAAIEAAAKYVDMIQIGARNMQNFQLLREAGRSGLPVLLKRGLAATIDEWLNAAEYIIAEGNSNVVLCERGIRFSAEDMLSTIQSEKEEHGSLDIETIRNIDVPSYVAGRSYSHLGEIAKYRKRALDQIIRYIGYLEQIHAPAEYLEQVKFLQKIVADLTIKAKDLKPFRFRL